MVSGLIFCVWIILDEDVCWFVFWFGNEGGWIWKDSKINRKYVYNIWKLEKFMLL